MATRFFAALAAVSFLLPAQTPPKVVKLEPANGSEVEAAKVKTLVATFDMDMNQDGWSLCGSGPAFPKTKDKPRWRDKRTLEVDVELEADHEYLLGLNCPAAQNTRSKDGVPLVPVWWKFTTLPGKVRPAAEQKKRNQAAMKALLKALDESYSYRDLRVSDWKKLEQEHAAALLNAKTDRGFAMAAAEMLKPTEDLHLYLRLGEQTFGAGSRAVDPLFRRDRLVRHLRVQPVGKNALAGRTTDGIGYLMIGGWSQDVDPEVIGGAITEMLDTKAMVIDVRPNAGGDESLAQKVAGWFVTGTRVYAKHRVRGPGKDGFGPIGSRAVEGLGESRHYDRPIAVLTSRYVMSSNESFVLMLRQAKDCTVVGQPTFGSSGNPRPFELGNGVTALIPSWQDLTLDGQTFEGIGIAPDVQVACKPEDLDKDDPILVKALEVLRAKVAAQPGK
ncbi:MAG: S41 family peptidase [Planctomycetota bacterium]